MQKKKKDNDHKFEVEEHVEIPKYKNIFCKRLHSELVARSFCDKKSQKLDRKLLGCIMKKAGQIEFRIEKLVKRKGDKLTVEWKNHYNLFNSWTD